jgi:hypothetical protein
VTEYRLLTEFRRLFQGKKYEHRRSNLGDFVAMHLYEDSVSVNKSRKYVISVRHVESVEHPEQAKRGRRKAK